MTLVLAAQLIDKETFNNTENWIKNVKVLTSNGHKKNSKKLNNNNVIKKFDSFCKLQDVS